MRLNIALFLALCLFTISIGAQQSAKGSFHGRVFDSLGALLGGVDVVLRDSAGVERRVQTNKEGVFIIDDLAAGKYSLRAASAGFSPFENTGIEILPGKAATLDITLEVTVTENVNVSDERPFGTDPDSNATATVLKEKDIEALPDDPL